MWFEEQSLSSLNQLKMSSLIVEEWRDIWSYKAEFMLIGVSYLFATTNFLNLPRLILDNGGLAFLAAYGAALAVVILPIVVLELSVGQLTGRAPIQALYNICPTFKGVGISQILVSLFVLAYMTKYLAWLLLYTFHLFWTLIDDRPGLPWLHCHNFPELQSVGIICREPSQVQRVPLNDDNGQLTPIQSTTTTTTTTITTTVPPTTTMKESTTTTTTTMNSMMETTTTLLEALLSTTPAAVAAAAEGSAEDLIDAAEGVTDAVAATVSAIAANFTDTANAVAAELTRTSRAAEFIRQNRLSTAHEESALQHFMRTLDKPSESVAEVGNLQLHFLIAQAAIWLVVFTAVCFGVRWLGKVVMLTSVLPIVLLIALCGRFLFLGGAVEMLQQFFYESTDWQRLYDYTVWKTAVEQAILASGVGFGAFITMGSYSKRNNNLVRDSVALVAGHVVICLLQLCTVISLVGYVHLRSGLSANELIEKGEAQMWQLLVYLSFLPYTKIFTAVLLLIATFGLINVFYLLSLCVLATLEDALGERWTRCFPRFVLAFLVAAVGVALSLYFATQAGRHAYELSSGYLKYFTLEVILAFELLAVAWFYTAHSLGKDVRQMLSGTNCCCWCFGYFLLIFTYLLPAVPVAIAVINVMAYSYDTYSPPIRNWPFSELLGLVLAVLPVVPIPLVALSTICRSCNYPSNATKCQRLRHAFRSPMHYELMKDSMMCGGGASEAGKTAATSPSVAAVSAPPPPPPTTSYGGYTLLSQHSGAPLAQHENYNLEAQRQAQQAQQAQAQQRNAH